MVEVSTVAAGMAGVGDDPGTATCGVTDTAEKTDAVGDGSSWTLLALCTEPKSL